jgi:cytidine deaminase
MAPCRGTTSIARYGERVTSESDRDLLLGHTAELAAAAWDVRERSRVIGRTKVGCAALTSTGTTWVGCNVEHAFRSHDIHAEVNAIGNMVAGGHQDLVCLMVVADRDRFTPCGSCLDWIFEFGGEECVVLVQQQVGGDISTYRAGELMPFYPR